ncbi:MAG TPA: hypothetical protein ACFYD7_05675 [Candidatus Wujingus californicus]|uniref:hypothetical protein n=1 Tax=Candidatus Wujingus californicus TaxID=3367618 RepID=UPI001DD8D74D|nr:hypothetical protein [Planctomycetota bacterium]MDO8131482.1 hypothetical protein [Candidatus Brocadiales bacterium]
MKSVKGLSGTSQAGGTKQRLPGDDLSNMGGSVGFMVNLFYFLHSDGNLMLRNFKQTTTRCFAVAVVSTIQYISNLQDEVIIL